MKPNNLLINMVKNYNSYVECWKKKVWRPPTSLFRRGHAIVNTTEFLNQILTHRILALDKKKEGEIFKVTSAFDWIAFVV